MKLYKIFLHTKSYILFIIVILPYILFQIPQLLEEFPPLPIIGYMSIFTVLLWLKSCKTLFNKIHYKKDIIFKLSYYSLFSFILLALILNLFYGEFHYKHESKILMFLFGLFGLFLFTSYIYLLLRIAKHLSKMKNQKKLGFDDYIGNFIKLFFFPIGIWSIQPKINKLYEENKDKFK
jgi:hypothetical protein